MKFFGRVRSGNARVRASSRPVADPESTITTEHASVKLGSPKDRYGMVENDDEKEIHSFEHNGIQGMTSRELEAEMEMEPERYEARDGAPETAEHVEIEDEVCGETTGEDEWPKKKKKKKNKKGKKKKKKSTGEGRDADDAHLIIDRVPTAMEYESDDSIEKMIDERSRYSRYTTEYDELDPDTFNDGEESEGPTDKYTGGTGRAIEMVLSNDSNPPVWRSWDEEDDRKKRNDMKKKKSVKKNGSVDADQQSHIYSKPSNLSKKSRESQRKKYKDLREFRKNRSTDGGNSNQKPVKEDEYSPYTLPDFNTPLDGALEKSGKELTDQIDNNSRQSKGSKNSKGSKDSHIASQNSKGSGKKGHVLPVAPSESWIAYNNTSGTFEKSTKGSIPPVMSDTSSLTDTHKRPEKYAPHVEASAQHEPREVDPPREIAASRPPKHSSKISNKEGIQIEKTGSGNQKVLPANSSRLPEKLNGYGDGPSGSNPSNSSSRASNSHRRSSKTGGKLYDRYAEIQQKQSNSTEVRTNRSSPKSATKKGHKGGFMYTKSLMTEDSSYVNEISPLGRSERTKRGQMKELDEYSVAMSVQDDPALVHCLKFYQCSAAASIARFATGWLPMGNTVTKEVKMLARGPDLDEVDKMRYREESLDPDPVTTAVEVVQEAENETSSVDNTDDATVDAPDLKAAVPNTNSYLREVTSLSLHLDDCGLEEEQQKPALDRGRAMAAEAEVDIAITEITIPHSSSLKIQKRLAQQNQHEDNQRMQQREAAAATEAEERPDLGSNVVEPTSKKEEEAVEDIAPEIEVINKKNSDSTEESSRPTSKKGLSKIFSRFGKKLKSKKH